MRYDLSSHGLGNILDLTVKLAQQNMAPILIISFLMQLPGLVVAVAQLLVVPNLDVHIQTGFANIEPMALAIIGLLALVSIIQTFLLIPVASGGIAVCLTADLFGETPDWKVALRHSWSRKWALLGASLLVILITGIGFLLLIIPGIYFALRLSLVIQAVVLDDEGGGSAPSRSGRLMSGLYWKALGMYAILIIGFFVFSATTQFFLIQMQFVAAFVNLLLQTVFGALMTCATTSLYFIARSKHEQFDLTVASVQQEIDTEAL